MFFLLFFFSKKKQKKYVFKNSFMLFRFFVVFKNRSRPKQKNKKMLTPHQMYNFWALTKENIDLFIWKIWSVKEAKNQSPSIPIYTHA